MGFSETSHNEADLVTVRTIGRLAQLLIELRAEYERRPNDTTLSQIRHRIREMSELEQQLGSQDVPTAV
ncbi:MAG: hypothetical protein M3Q29_01670 [Chloroflexota bacterium]|nr:hypothetical protein [Chloroflexota bacterium]